MQFVFCIADDNEEAIAEDTQKPVKVEAETDILQTRPDPQKEALTIESDSKVVEELSESLNGETDTNGSLQDDGGSAPSPSISKPDNLDDQKDKESSELEDSKDHDISDKKTDPLPLTNQTKLILDESTDISVAIDNSFCEKVYSPESKQAENDDDFMDVTTESEESHNGNEVSHEKLDEDQIKGHHMSAEFESKEKIDSPDEVLEVDDEELDHEQAQLEQNPDNEGEELETDRQHSQQSDSGSLQQDDDPSKTLLNVLDPCTRMAAVVNDCPSISKPDEMTEEITFQSTDNTAVDNAPVVIVEAAHDDLRHQASESQDIYIEIPQPSFTDGFPEDIFDD